MKAVKIILGVCICFCTAFTLSAQEKARTSKPVASWEKNWYIEVGGGGQLLFTKDANRLSFMDRVTPAVSFTVGRWINPYWGLRVQAQGYSMNGFISHENALINDPIKNHVDILPDGSFPYFGRYMDVHADVQFSLANLFGGYKHSRKWDIIPAVGIGYFHAFPYKGTVKNDSYSGHFSMMFKYRLPKGFDLNLEIQSSVMPDGFNDIETGHPSGIVGANIGVTYHFGKYIQKRRNKKQSTPQSSIDQTTIRNIIREELKNVEPVKAGRDTVYVVKNVEKVKEVATKKISEPFTLASIRFDIGESTPVKGQDVQIINVADYLKKNPNAKIRIEGYADASTGSVKHNRFLSMQRAVEIFTILKEKYGIDEKQMEDVQGIGSDYQPYEDIEWNRIVLVKVIE